MVQSVCLTSRGSGVRLPQLPRKNAFLHCREAFFRTSPYELRWVRIGHVALSRQGQVGTGGRMPLRQGQVGTRGRMPLRQGQVPLRRLFYLGLCRLRGILSLPAPPRLCCRRAILLCSNDGAASIPKFGHEIKNRCRLWDVSGENLAAIAKLTP